VSSLSCFVDEHTKVGTHARVDYSSIWCDSHNLFKGRLIGKDALVRLFRGEDNAVRTPYAQGRQTLSHCSEGIFDLCELPGGRKCCQT
jgi:hypothetical protein